MDDTRKMEPRLQSRDPRLDGQARTPPTPCAWRWHGRCSQSRAALSFRQQVVVAVPDSNEIRLLSSWLEAEGYDALRRPTPQAATREITAQLFDLLVADCAFVLSGGVRGYGLARFRETPVIVL